VTLRRLTTREYLVNLVAAMAAMPLYKRREWRAPDATRAWQLRRIARLVDRAYAQVPLYRDKYQAVGYRPGALRTWDDFTRLPTVTKEEIAGGYPDRSVARDTPLERCLLSTSSGSTGRVMVIAHRADRNWAYALATQRLLRWAAGGGYPFWYRQAYIYTSPYPTPQLPGIFPLIFIPTANAPGPMLDALRRTRPHLLTAYPTVLRDLLAADPQGMRALGLRGVSVSSELSTQEERDAWSEILGCPVRDEYSSEELTRIAAQCPEKRYHLMEDIVYSEILEAGSDRAAVGLGEVVGTELHNTAMPFIRYRQGDLALIERPGCPCGRPSRLLGALQGRANDGFFLADGRRLSAGFLLDAAYRALMSRPGAMVAYRLIQRSLDAVELQVVPGPAWSPAAADELSRGLRAALGGGLRIYPTIVDTLERGGGGKRATIVRDPTVPVPEPPPSADQAAREAKYQA